MLGQLFEAMKGGGLFGVDEIPWFNGGLFDDSASLPLTVSDLEMIVAASALDWSDIDPSIFGTLFERGLDPAKRAQLGAHYTNSEKIMMIVNPVVAATFHSLKNGTASDVKLKSLARVPNVR